MSRRVKGSRRRDKARKRVETLHHKARNIRRTHAHQVNARLVLEYDLVAVEDLSARGLAQHQPGKPVRDQTWPMLFDMLEYKAERASAHFVKVDPEDTIQEAVDKAVLGLGRHDAPGR